MLTPADAKHAATILEAVAIVVMGPDAHVSPLTAWRLADAVVALAAALAEHEGCDDCEALRTEREALARLVAVLFQAEHADLPHRQFIYRSGPQDWDAEPMSEEDHDLIRAALAASTAPEPAPDPSVQP